VVGNWGEKVNGAPVHLGKQVDYKEKKKLSKKPICCESSFSKKAWGGDIRSEEDP